MLTAEPVDPSAFDEMKGARGCIDAVDYGSNQVAGWILSPDVELSSVEVYLNGSPAGSAGIEFRNDVANAYRWITHAGRSGFRVHLQPGLLRATGVNRVYVLGCQNGRPVVRMSDLFRKELGAAVPLPPARLMKRVQGQDGPEAFKFAGYKYYVTVMDAVARHRDPRSVQTVLDWGCGCGRVAVHFQADPNRLRVFGCDIDAEAVAWCREHVPGGEFASLDRTPPMPYPDGAFDAIYAVGVLMSLNQEAQEAWLPELRRVLASNGLLVTSVQGELAAPFVNPPEAVAELRRDGIIGRWDLDPGIFQTRAHTYREWSKYFEILEYVEAGLNAHHDLVVLRRPA
jgi:SAM-dependent methyltransferase